MSAAASNFDAAAEMFADYGTSLRGFIRYQLIRRNLEPYLSKKPMRVLDAGGGSGPDAAWLSQAGHQVVLVEPSQEQRSYAERRFNFFLQPAQRERITVFPQALTKLPAAQTGFDLVLVHGVAMYQTHPNKFIAEALSRLKPGGVISIVEKGYYGTLNRLVREERFDELATLQKHQRAINNVSADVYAFRPEELESLLTQGSAKVLSWSAIRLLTDPLDTQVSIMDQAVVQELAELEYELGQRSDLRAGGQMLHFIARKK